MLTCRPQQHQPALRQGRALQPEQHRMDPRAQRLEQVQHQMDQQEQHLAPELERLVQHRMDQRVREPREPARASDQARVRAQDQHQKDQRPEPEPVQVVQVVQVVQEPARVHRQTDQPARDQPLESGPASAMD